jgi:purine-nucleoside phosphorylase
MGMKVLGISCVTNAAAGVLDQKLNHAEVLEVGARMNSTLIELLRRIIARL